MNFFKKVIVFLVLKKKIKASGVFDEIFYLKKYDDVRAADVNPLYHFIRYGLLERRWPSAKAYKSIKENDESSSLVELMSSFRHYRMTGQWKEPRQDFSMMNVQELQNVNEYVPARKSTIPPPKAVRAICFYLPQYHPIPENDKWWGKGFTEWTNVRPAVPQFSGHYQPHIPHDDIGYYSLLDKETQIKQINLAKQYGIEGFCYYLYWFSGKRLLETPLDNMLADPSLDFPFCVCWANENWSRRWDGRDQDLLMVQNYSDKDDIDFIENIYKYLVDPRYIRINGRPLLIVYRPNLFPDMKKTSERWRSWCRNKGLGEIYLAYTQSFESVSPECYGFDAAIEFPPNNSNPPNITEKLPGLKNDFEGNVYDWSVFLERSRQPKKVNYKLFRSATPSWDNTARKKNKGTIFYNSSPDRFKELIFNVFTTAVKENAVDDERLVFINAWNEWAEGAHLEPDQRYGYAWLDAVANAHERIMEAAPPVLESPAQGRGCQDFLYFDNNLQSLSDDENASKSVDILFVSHDAHNGGAQKSLLSIIDFFVKRTSYNVKCVLLGGGPHIEKFMSLCPTIKLEPGRMAVEDIQQTLNQFCFGKPSLLYCNTVASGVLLKKIGHCGDRVITHIREQEASIKQYGGDWLQDILDCSDKLIACSYSVKNMLVEKYGFCADLVDVVYTSLDDAAVENLLLYKKDLSYKKSLGLAKDDILILGSGIGMPDRKGADLFVQTYLFFSEFSKRRMHFRWVGEFNKDASCGDDLKWSDWLNKIRKASNPLVSLDFISHQDDPFSHFVQADVFLLTSREEPLGRAALEAILLDVPVFAFKGCGGFEEVLGTADCFLVNDFKADLLVQKIKHYLGSEDDYKKDFQAVKQKVLSEFVVSKSFPPLLKICDAMIDRQPSVSVVVPNYNYEKYLDQRMQSILKQTYQDFEIIILDDCSTDDSRSKIEAYVNRYPSFIRAIYNEKNSGSPYPQWFKGIENSRSDLIWIAEADDICEYDFLEKMVSYFDDPRVGLAYSASKIIDEQGRQGADYRELPYLKDLSPTRWNSCYIASADNEASYSLGVKNTVLNISGCVFKKFDMGLEMREKIESMIMGGDTLFLLNCIKDSFVAYHAEPINYHRRHKKSAIHKELSKDYVRELFLTRKMLHDFVRKNFSVDDCYEELVSSYVEALAKEHAPSEWKKVINDFYY